MAVSNTQYDDAFKELAERDPEALLLLLGAVRPHEALSIEVLSRELRAGKQISDQIYLVRTALGAHIVHVEAQTRWDPEMPRRMLMYALLIWLTYEGQYEMDCYVLLLTPERLPAQVPETLSVTAGSLRMTVSFRVARVWEMPAAAALALDRPQVLPFVPLMQGDEADLRGAALRVLQLPDVGLRDSLFFSLLVLGSLRYTHDELVFALRRGTMFGITFEQFQQTPTYQLLFKVAKEEGLERGREEGREEGRAQAAADILAKLAARRFPAMDWRAQIAGIEDWQALEQLCLDFAQVPNAETLQQKLSVLRQG